MRKLMNRLVGICFLSLVLIIGVSNKTNAQNISVSFQTFYDNLSPYGQWVYDPDYGDVWVPNEGGDFRPYGSRGHWLMTEYGNTWISEDPWGWAVYHYGRWTYNPYYGWIWVPGYEWAPAWVTWRYGGGYSGWAPLGPNIGVGISWAPPISWWVFVNPQYMYQPNLIRHWRGPSYNNTYINQTTIINNYFVDNHTSVRYNYGPRAEVIQRNTGRPVQVYQVSQLNRPGAPSVGRNSVSLYRPTVNQATVRTARPQNVIQAPRSIGRTVQAAPAPEGNRQQPQFRQELPRLQNTQPRNEQIQRGGQAGGRGNEPALRQQQAEHGRGEQMQREPQGRQPQMQREQQDRNQQIQRQPQDRNDQMQRQQQMQREQQDRNQQLQRQPQDRNEQMQRQQLMQREQQQRSEQMQRQQQDRNEQLQRQQQMQREQQQRNEQMQRQQQDRNEQMQREQQQRNDQMQRQQQMQREQQQRNDQIQRQQQMQREQQQRNDQMQRQQQMQQQQQQRNEQMQRQQQMQQQRQPQMEQRQAPQGQPQQRGEGGGRR